MSDIKVIISTPEYNIVTFNEQWPAWAWIVWEWTYDNLTAYSILDAVYYNGSAYICIANSTWNLPTDTDFWDILVSKWDQGTQGNWIASIIKTSTVGLVDTYTITYDDLTTSTFDVTNWAKWDKGDQGIQWIQGIQGIQWIQGVKWDKWDTWLTWAKWDKWDTGATWHWVVVWWTTWQILAKKSNTDYDTEWKDDAGWHVIQDEWTPLTQRTNLNFIWGNVSVSDNLWDNSTDVTVLAWVVNFTNLYFSDVLSDRPNGNIFNTMKIEAPINEILSTDDMILTVADWEVIVDQLEGALWYITKLWVPNNTIISAEQWTTDLWFSVSDTEWDSYWFCDVKIYDFETDSFRQLFRFTTPKLTSATPTKFTITSTQPDFTMKNTDRLCMVVWSYTSWIVEKTIIFYHSDSKLSRVIVPVFYHQVPNTVLIESISWDNYPASDPYVLTAQGKIVDCLSWSWWNIYVQLPTEVMQWPVVITNVWNEEVIVFIDNSWTIDFRGIYTYEDAWLPAWYQAVKLWRAQWISFWASVLSWLTNVYWVCSWMSRVATLNSEASWLQNKDVTDPQNPKWWLLTETEYLWLTDWTNADAYHSHIIRYEAPIILEWNTDVYITADYVGDVTNTLIFADLFDVWETIRLFKTWETDIYATVIGTSSGSAPTNRLTFSIDTWLTNSTSWGINKILVADMAKSENLFWLTDYADARRNLWLWTAATSNASDFVPYTWATWTVNLNDKTFINVGYIWIWRTANTNITIDWWVKAAKLNTTQTAWTDLVEVRHIHSTTLPVQTLDARSNSDDAIHAPVTNWQVIHRESKAWRATTSYYKASETDYGIDSTWTISDTSMPWKIVRKITPNWSVTPVAFETVTNDWKVVFANTVSASNISVTNSTDIAWKKNYHWVLSRLTTSPLPTNLTTTTFTLACNTTPMTYYRNWVSTTVSTSKTTTLSWAAWLYYIYFNDDAWTLTNSTVFPWLDWTNVLIAYVYWNWTNYWIVYDERHSYDRDIAWHTWAHLTIWARYGSWLDFSFAWNVIANTTFSISAGNIYDEDINFSISTQTSARIWYQTWASTYAFDTTLATTPYKHNWTWIQAVNSAWYWLVTITQSNRYFNYWVYWTNSALAPIHIFAETTATIWGYTSVNNARAVVPPSLAWLWISPEYKLLYRLVVNWAWLIQTLIASDDYRTTSTISWWVVPSSTASSVTETNYWNVQTAINTLIAADAALVSDTAYDATTWDWVTTIAPSKNAVRDKFETLWTWAYATIANYAPLANPTFTWTVTLPTIQLWESSLKLDAALSADWTWSWITEIGTAWATLVFWDLCYFQASDSRWELVDANVSAWYDKKLWICVLAAAADWNATEMLLIWKIRADSRFPTLTIWSPIYMSETAWDIVVAQPTTTDVCIRKIWFWNTADELYFCPSTDFITHT